MTLNFRDLENWAITPSDEDLALLAITRPLLGVNGDIQELSITIALTLESCGLAVRVFETFPFVERCPCLQHFEIPAP